MTTAEDPMPGTASRTAGPHDGAGAPEGRTPAPDVAPATPPEHGAPNPSPPAKTGPVRPAQATGPNSPDSPPSPLAPYERFLRTVRKACDSPGGRAALRQGLADELASPWRLYMHLLPHGTIPASPATRETEYPYLLVACLYAVHDAPNPRTPAARTPSPKPADRRHNLGWSYARAAATHAMRARNAADALSHLAQLDADDLYRELPGAVSLLRSHGVPVRWPVLLRDLTRWPTRAEYVRIEWARAFHAPAPMSEAKPIRTSEVQPARAPEAKPTHVSEAKPTSASEAKPARAPQEKPEKSP
ncbi:type I-E CRISPR-associated protein Cse2/CasB [Streptomyces sp. NPDC003077]|uniref:type I-E CRISPR-associated protein Cse2/CasB n=1 Tax=Streptomyces sp. NPDC003077 TaxID=3154443 RepID=UPI0033B95780